MPVMSMLSMVALETEMFAMSVVFLAAFMSLIAWTVSMSVGLYVMISVMSDMSVMVWSTGVLDFHDGIEDIDFCDVCCVFNVSDTLFAVEQDPKNLLCVPFFLVQIWDRIWNCNSELRK
jgi:hypothetical protein